MLLNLPQLGDYEKFAAALGLYETKKVHVHCGCNWRVSAFYGAYAVSKGYWNRQEAKDFINGIWAPAEYPRWHDLLDSLGL